MRTMSDPAKIKISTSNNNIITTTTTTTSSTINNYGHSSSHNNRRRASTGGSGGSASRFACIECWSDLFASLLRFRVTPEEVEQRYKSREIDKLLEQERKSKRRQVKLLLLGAGESGKSTFLKQMRIINGVRFETETIREYQHVIYQNILKGMQVLVDAREKLGINWEHPTNELAANQARFFNSALGAVDAAQFTEYSPVVHVLWQDSAIKTAFERRREFQLSDSVSYFLNELDRIARLDYIPSHRDILHCRKATKGVYEFTIRIRNIPFVFVDVGGQRAQRQKWTKCFDCSVTSILFLVSTSEFDQVLAEDRKTKRLDESRNIFDTIVNNSSFQSISIILFLNKSDLLEAKLLKRDTDIRWFYPEFKGDPYSVTDVQTFILHKFLSVRKTNAQSTPIYHHFTNAVDTNNIKKVFDLVLETILRRNLADHWL